MIRLFAADATRELDRIAIAECGVSGLELMQRAGRAAFDSLRRRWPEATRIAVYCGTGNNGGDGFHVAELAARAGLDVRLYVCGEPDTVGGDARTCLEGARAAGLELQGVSACEADVVVDALFGTGLAREVGGPHAEAIAVMNAAPAPVLALDIPSGLHASSGAVLGSAVQATATITFIAHKSGLVTGDGPAVCGDLECADLELPPELYERVDCRAFGVTYESIVDRLQPRRRTAHKGDFGHVLVVGGAPGFSGAARMAAETAARSGAGLVSVATHPAHAATLNTGRPELMVHAVADASDLRALCSRATVIACGPGLGQDAWGRTMLGVVAEQRVPQVLDADALNQLAQEPDRSANRILTPHPGEAGRLLGWPTGCVQADRYAAADALCERYGGVVILKGAGTVVAVDSDDAAPWSRVVLAGNPGMASGGMGDVLTGLVAGLVAQQDQGAQRDLGNLGDAALLAAVVHARAGDEAARAGERGLLAGDLPPVIRRLLNPTAT